MTTNNIESILATMSTDPPGRPHTRQQAKLASVLNDPEEMTKRATEHFREADEDGSGALDHEEVFNLLVKIIDRANREGHDGVAFSTPTREKVQVMLDKHGRDGDNKQTGASFKGWTIRVEDE